MGAECSPAEARDLQNHVKRPRTPPLYLYQLFPASPLAAGDAIPVNPDYRIDETDSYSYNTATALTFGSRLGTRLTTTAEYRRTDFRMIPPDAPNLETYASGATVSRALSRKVALSARIPV